MGKRCRGELGRGLLVGAVLALGALPVTSVTFAQASPAAVADAPRVAGVRRSADDLDPQRPPLGRSVFGEAKLSLIAPPGWQLAPSTSLNPPGSPVFELARFQPRAGDVSLYAQPVPLTSGLVADAGAVLSIGLAREGSELEGLPLDARLPGEVTTHHGFYVLEEAGAYEGVTSLTRYFVARETARAIVVQAVAPADRWTAIEPLVRDAMSSLRAEQDGPNGPAAPPPPAPPAAPPAAEPAPAAPPDPSAEIRAAILLRAAALLGLPYVWGGNSTSRGMDCSAYVSWTWAVDRYTTDSIWAVSHLISKDELLPGDAMNLTIGRDPDRAGHIRIFEAWANAAHTLVWVYEETPPRAMHRVIAYDPRYQSIRLNGLSGAGQAPLVVAPPTPVEPQLRVSAPRTARPSARPATPRPARTATPTPRRTATPVITPRTTATPRPLTTVKPTPTRPPLTTTRPR